MQEAARVCCLGPWRRVGPRLREVEVDEVLASTFVPLLKRPFVTVIDRYIVLWPWLAVSPLLSIFPYVVVFINAVREPYGCSASFLLV